ETESPHFFLGAGRPEFSHFFLFLRSTLNLGMPACSEIHEGFRARSAQETTEGATATFLRGEAQPGPGFCLANNTSSRKDLPQCTEGTGAGRCCRAPWPWRCCVWWEPG